MFGPGFAMKGALGTASHRVPDTDVVVGAIAAVNAVGDIYHPDTRQILAGARWEEGRGFRDTMAAIMGGYRVVTSTGSNTTIGEVATNVPFTKAEMSKIAQMAHDGYARSINPVHTISDGGRIFALSTGKVLSVRADVSANGVIAATVMAHAVARAVVQAESLTEHQLPAHESTLRGELGSSAQSQGRGGAPALHAPWASSPREMPGRCPRRALAGLTQPCVPGRVASSLRRLTM